MLLIEIISSSEFVIFLVYFGTHYVFFVGRVKLGMQLINQFLQWEHFIGSVVACLQTPTEL